jgi:hypothetical protein
LKAEKLSELLQIVLTNCAADLQAGALVTVYEHRIKIRQMPAAQ